MAALMMVPSCFTALSPISGAAYLQARNKSIRYPTDSIFFQCSLREHHIGLRHVLKMYVIIKAETVLSFMCTDLNFSIL